MPANLSRLIRLAPSAQSDRDLLRAHLDGADPTAFDELVRRHAGLAQRAAAEVCPFAADDVAQTALALLARNASAVASRESAAGWVFETARRLALKARTAAARRTACEAHANPPQPLADPLDTLTLREVRATVAEELARLPDELRLPLLLCYWDGSTQSEAAARLGCSLTTLKRRLDTGRDRLAGRLARRGFAGSAVLAALTVVQAGADAAVPVARSAVAGFAPWKVLSAVVVAASVAAAGIGIGVSTPVGADPPSQPTKPVTPPPAEVAQPGPALDRYGDPLPDGAVARFGSIRFRHGRSLESIAYSPDGKTIASGGEGRVMLWEAETGKPIPLVRKVTDPAKARRDPMKPQLEEGHTFRLAFTPDGKTLLSTGTPSPACDRDHIEVWDLTKRQWISSIKYPDVPDSRGSRSIAVSPDGKTIAAASDSGHVLILDGRTHRLVTTLKLRGGFGLSFSPDGKTLAVGTLQDVVLLDPATGKETGRLDAGWVGPVAFAPDGKSLWVGLYGTPWSLQKPCTISRWDLRTGIPVQTFETGPVRSLAVSPDGKTLASGGQQSTPLLWGVDTGKAVKLDQPRSIRAWAFVEGLAFAPDGKTLAAADSNGQVRVWDIATRRELHRHDEHVGGILNVSLSPDGKQAATVGWDGTVRIWDVATGQAIRFWTADATASVNYTPDGRSLLTAGWGGTVRLWDAATGKEVRRFRDERGFARAAVSPDGRLVAASGKDLVSITLYETATGRPIRELTGHTSSLSLLTFSPDSRQLISAADMFFVPGGQLLDDRSVRVWDVTTGLQIHKIDAGRPQRGAAVSPDGRVVAVGVELEEEKTKYLRFWDTVTGKELAGRRMKDVGWPAFSPDGRYLATAKHDDIRVIEVASGRVVQAFEGVGASVNGMTFTPDGRRLVSAHDDGTALVWDVTPHPMNGTNPTKLWYELASDDAAAARRATWTLAADPVATVTLLSEKLKPAPKRARTTASLIADLNAPDFQTREAASRELVGRVNADSAELTAALAKSPSAETRQRLGEILQSAPGPWPKLDVEDLRRVRAVGVLEAIGTPEARRILKALADGDPYAHLTREARAVSRRLGG